MTEKVVGETVAAVKYNPKPYESWFFLYPEYADIAELMQTGVVYEVLEERENDRCYGIVETSTIETDQQILDATLSSRRGLSTKAVKLRVTRESGLDAPVSDKCPVRLAGPDGIKAAYGIPDSGIPVGIFTLPSGYSAQTCTVKIPTSYFLGKEAAHGNIGGKSGYCKTGLSLVLCKSLLSDSELSKFTSVIAFNVKADDLLWPDYKNIELTDEDVKLYEMMGVPPKPFDKVHIFAPESSDGGIDSLREDAEPFSWEWLNVRDQLHFCIAEEDWNERLEAILVDLVSQDMNEFREAESLLSTWLSEAETAGRGWGHGHHIETIRKTIRIISRGIMERFKGLLCGRSEPLPIEKLLTPRFFSVIDISRLRTPAQRLVIGKVVSDAQDLLERGETKVKKLVYLCDELSKFAPRQARTGPTAGIKTILEDIAERGRSIGSIILGIQQYPSEVSDAILGNVATNFYAKMKSTELSATIYRGYPKEKKQLIQAIGKGLAILDHDEFNDLILVKFPRPPCAQTRPPRTLITDCKKVQ